MDPNAVGKLLGLLERIAAALEEQNELVKEAEKAKRLVVERQQQAQQEADMAAQIWSGGPRE